MSGRKDDGGKMKWRLLPWKQLEQVVKVLTDGADHYGIENWKEVPTPVERYSDALGRHVSDYMMGKKIDSKSGLPTLAHVVCNALFLMWFDNNKEVKSDGKSTHSTVANRGAEVGMFYAGKSTPPADKGKTCGANCPVCHPESYD